MFSHPRIFNYAICEPWLDDFSVLILLNLPLKYTQIYVFYLLLAQIELFNQQVFMKKKWIYSSKIRITELNKSQPLKNKLNQLKFTFFYLFTSIMDQLFTRRGGIWNLYWNQADKEAGLFLATLVWDLPMCSHYSSLMTTALSWQVIMVINSYIWFGNISSIHCLLPGCYFPDHGTSASYLQQSPAVWEMGNTLDRSQVTWFWLAFYPK